uniref:Uncharacterized protein n=1 Tax=Culex tarsalis TaxID=7177 RepID=A0A1Q3FJQ3_CULTA
MSVLSTNNSDSFLQNLAHIDQRDRERQDRREQDDTSGGGGGGGGVGSGSGSGGGSTKPEDMLLLEKQGRCSQKLRSNQLSNLAHVTQTVGQNMTDISNIGGNKIPKMLSNMGGGNQQPPSAPNTAQPLPPRKDNRGSSLPPSALPRPPRSLKPPRKIEYGRLSDSEGKKRAETPPTPGAMDAQKEFEMKTSSLKRGGFGKGREFSPGKSYMEMKDAAMHLAKDYGGTLKSKNYGSLGNTSSISGGGSPTKNDGKFGFGGGMKSSGMAANSCEFSKPDYTSTKNYQRLEEQTSSSRKNSADNMKRSLLPNVRKLSSGGAPIMIKGSRDSLNSASSGSNNSNNRTSPMHPASSQQALQQLGGGGYHHHNHLHHGRTPPRFIHHQQSTSAESSKSSSNLPSPTTPTGNLPQPFFNNGNKMAPKPHQQQHKPSTLPSASILHAAVTASATSAIGQQTTASLPPKPGQQQQQQQQPPQQRRGSSLTRSENKYRIQF